MYCANRFPLAGVPSLCTLDTAMVPIPSIILVVALFALFYRHSYRPREKELEVPKWLTWTYIALVICAFGMSLLEVARMSANGEGVGLLPFNMAAILLVMVAVIIDRRARRKEFVVLFLVYWTAFAALEAVKVWRLHQLELIKPVPAGYFADYLPSDQFLDNAVMIGLYVVFMAFEITALLSPKYVRHDASEVSKA